MKRCANSWMIIPGKKTKDKRFIDKKPERVLLIVLESKNNIAISAKSKIKKIIPKIILGQYRNLINTFHAGS